MTDYALAANFIEQFEGYTPIAKWDVDAYRLGYGSDTEGPDQVKVTKGMVTTRERAFANLEARIPAFEKVIIGQIGSVTWEVLPDQAKAALLSMAYNYGDLPANVAHAIISHDSLSLIASAVEARDGDDHGINKTRRLKEAQYIASAAASPVPQAAPAALATALTPPAHLSSLPQAQTNQAPIDITKVEGMQEALNVLLPTDPLKVDGGWGPLTVAKMKAFQASQKLKETGDGSFFSALAVYQALQKAGIPTVNPT
jgi:hypothetical protein